MKKVTMQDIADALHISKNSVSQALGNKNGVGEQTKRLVLQKADEMGYQYKKDVIYTPTDNQFALVATEFALSQKSFFWRDLPKFGARDDCSWFLFIDTRCRARGDCLKPFAT
nr:helix-turn-helix domain-containing protein [Listeria rocourtiae]